MTTRIRHVIERAYGPPQAPPAPYFQTMKESRGFLSWTAVMLVVLGTIQGTVVTVIWHLHARTAVLFIGAEILISLVWLPIAYTVMRIFEARLPRASRVGLVVVLGVASFFVEPIGVALLGRIGAPSPPYARRVLARLDTNVLFYLTLAGIAWAAAARRRHMASELAAARVQAALADAQLHVLTLQLHPHFLFNALNLISQLAYESVEAAQRTVANLRALLVESLRHAVHREVELHDELSFLDAYLEIQQARFRERLHVAISAPKELDDAAVPHLVLQPLEIGATSLREPDCSRLAKTLIDGPARHFGATYGRPAHHFGDG